MTVHDEDYVAQPQPADRRSGTIWILFLAGPTIWITHFMAVYLLGEVLCKPLQTGVAIAGLPLVSFLTIVATVLAAIATLAFTALSYRRWQASGAATARSAAEEDVVRAHEGVLALTGVLLGALFFVAVLFTGAPALVVQPC